MPSITVEAPASSWGLIIGKGGETLKRLQMDFQVTIKVPRQDQEGKVTVSASNHDACLRCADAILKIGNENGRGPAKPKSKPGGKNTTADRAARPWPPSCALCDVRLGSISDVAIHLCSKKHLDNLDQRMPGLGLQMPLEVLDVVSLLEDQIYHTYHEELDFRVDELCGLLRKEHERRAKARHLVEEATLLTPDLDWLRVESRHVVRWDDSLTTSDERLPLLRAPPLDDLLRRIGLQARPPMVREVQLPLPLPRMDPKRRPVNKLKAQHIYPASVDSVRLGIATVQKLGQSHHTYDIFCGTSFIKALSGDSSSSKDTFYLQQISCRGTDIVFCLHEPSNYHGQDDVGHAVERLLCGCSGPYAGGIFFAVTSLVIDGVRLLVTSEVDASNVEGQLVELKSSSSKEGSQFVTAEVALQTLVNGSEYVVGCCLDKEKSNLNSVVWLPIDEAKNAHAKSLVAMGQRVRLLLRRVIAHMQKQAAAASGSVVGNIVMLTFDDIKAPRFVKMPVEKAVEVLPWGFVS